MVNSGSRSFLSSKRIAWVSTPSRSLPTPGPFMAGDPHMFWFPARAHLEHTVYDKSWPEKPFAIPSSCLLPIFVSLFIYLLIFLNECLFPPGFVLNLQDCWTLHVDCNSNFHMVNIKRPACPSNLYPLTDVDIHAFNKMMLSSLRQIKPNFSKELLVLRDTH